MFERNNTEDMSYSFRYEVQFSVLGFTALQVSE